MTYQEALNSLTEKEKQIYTDYNSIHFAYCDCKSILSDIGFLDSEYEKIINAAEDFSEKLPQATTKKARNALLEDFISIVHISEKYNTFHRAIKLGHTEKKIKEHEQKLKQARDNMSEEYSLICAKLNNITD